MELRSRVSFSVRAERPEEVERTQMAPVVEGGGQHADDLVGFAVDANRAADDVGVTPEAVLPVAVTDDEDAVVARDALRRDGSCGRARGSTPRVEKRLAEMRRPRAISAGSPGSERLMSANAVGGNLAVAVHLGLQIEVVGRREAAPRVLGSGAIDAVQLTAVGIGQRAQQVFIEDAERRRVGADAEPERDDGDEGEAGRATAAT